MEVCEFIHSSLSCTVSTSPPHKKHTSYYFLSLLLKKMSDVLEVDYFSLTLSQLFIFFAIFSVLRMGASWRLSIFLCTMVKCLLPTITQYD